MELSDGYLKETDCKTCKTCLKFDIYIYMYMYGIYMYCSSMLEAKFSHRRSSTTRMLCPYTRNVLQFDRHTLKVGGKLAHILSIEFSCFLLFLVLESFSVCCSWTQLLIWVVFINHDTLFCLGFPRLVEAIWHENIWIYHNFKIVIKWLYIFLDDAFCLPWSRKP